MSPERIDLMGDALWGEHDVRSVLMGLFGRGMYSLSLDYLVFSTGGGFGNQLSQLVSFAWAALLSNRIPVALPAYAESQPELAFDIRAHWRPTDVNFIHEATGDDATDDAAQTFVLIVENQFGDKTRKEISCS